MFYERLLIERQIVNEVPTSACVVIIGSGFIGGLRINTGYSGHGMMGSLSGGRTLAG